VSHALADGLRHALEALRAGRRSFALIGGLAVSARAEPRFTRDADFAVSVASDAEAEAVALDLVQRGYRLLTALEQDSRGRLAGLRMLSPAVRGTNVVVDLMFASSGIESEIVAAAEPLEIFSGLVVPVATKGHLIALKVLARDDEHRPQDRIDLRELLRVASDEDLAQAVAALELITVRGFNRGRGLMALLGEARARLPSR
jgi:hypothetical protein